MYDCWLSDGMATLSQHGFSSNKKKNPEPSIQVDTAQEEKEPPVEEECDGLAPTSLMGDENLQGSDCEEEIGEYVQQPDYVENHDCIKWKQGVRKDTSNQSKDDILPASIWGDLSLMTKGSPPNTETIWDAMFAERGLSTQKSEDGEEGLDLLLGLFEESPDDSGIQGKNQNLLSPPADDGGISMSMLSQDAQKVASKFCEEIASDTTKISQLGLACPNWKENIAFALFQKDNGGLTEALENVKKSRNRMLERKRKLLEAWERQDMALQVFESALSTSLDRSIQSGENNGAPSQSPSSGQEEVIDCGFLTVPMSQEETNEQEDNEIDGLSRK